MANTIAVFSTKGGVGKTLVTTNLAVSLVKDQAKRVCLIDLDLQLPGDMARMLNINAPKGALDLIAYLKKDLQPTVSTLKKYEFLTKTSFGLDFLPGVLRPQQSSNFEADKLKDVFDFLSKDYDFMIVDVGKNFSEAFVATLNHSNLILLVVTPDILSIYQTRWALDTLQFLQIPLSMVKIVLNRADSISSISLDEIRASLPIDIIMQLPSEGRAVGMAVNRGVPVVIDSPRTKFSQGIIKLSQQLATDTGIFIVHKDIDQLKLKETVIEKSGEFWAKFGLAEAPLSTLGEEEDEILILKRRIHSRLIEELNIKKLDLKVFSDPTKKKELKNKAEMLVSNLLVEESGMLISSHEVRKKLVKEIIDEALGLGPLEDLLADADITDIMVNNKDEIYIEKKGKLELTNKKFLSNDQVKTTIERIIAPIGRRIDESVPMVDARLPDGSRVNSIIPPLSLGGPTLTIRKFRKERFKVEELIALRSFNNNMSEFIKACVLTRKNIIVSGGTGSGKTTVLNVLSAFIPNDERIITLEDAAELKLHQEHWVRLESRAANIEGKGQITIRDLFRNTLRMRPDRIIVGECRGIETLDMLQAMNTGHDGSMTTIHANSTHDVLSRLDSMILMSGVELPVRAIREMVASAIDVIIHTARLPDGTRKIVEISQVIGMRDEIHIEIQNIFIFRQLGIDAQHNVLGDFYATGYIPSFMDEMKRRGTSLSEEIFRSAL
ncbi:MAG: ATPase, T2SS/T4P/T4SS family [Candidatus Omnitrophica bacterium]|nr:ATPase, T2SS/T4P/T4SS family [Candidatus Omnitrophota bacterium]